MKPLLALVAALGLGSVAFAQKDLVLEEAQPIWPDSIAVIHADGTYGPSLPYKRPGGGIAGALTPVWDSYEVDPSTYNNVDNIPCEFYEVPRGSDPPTYCLGPCDGRRYRWCGPGGCTTYAFTSQVATGGIMVPDTGGNLVTVISFLVGVRGAAEPLTVEFTIYDNYSGSDCLNPGDTVVGGVALTFDSLAEGFWRATADLTGGFELPTPADGTLGIGTKYFLDRDAGVFSRRAFPGLWATKSEWADRMGDQDEAGFDDWLDPNEFLDDFDCIASAEICPDGLTNLVGQGVLLLTGGAACDACDMNCDGLVNASDIAGFIARLFDDADPCCGNRGDPGHSGDTNGDGVVNASDIPGFIDCLFG